MLQQTRVETVLERYWGPFLERFPTLSSVAAATEGEVLKAWEGLGYYNRARYLHRTARLCDGALPRSAAELEKLPGIGRSTAHAIACFAFDEPLPILDANVRRILHRFFALDEATPSRLWEAAGELFDAGRPYDYNQAMMDLGAMVCTPKAPECSACPLREGCAGREDPQRYPRPRKRPGIPVRKRQILVLRRGDALGLVRNEGRFLGGMWSFPQRIEAPRSGRKIGKVRRTYSHFRIEGSVWEVKELPDEKLRFFTPAECESLAMSALDRDVLKLVKKEMQ